MGIAIMFVTYVQDKVLNLNLKFLKWNTNVIHFPFLEPSITFLGISRWIYEVGLPTCADWPGFIMVAKANHFRFQKDKVNNI